MSGRPRSLPPTASACSTAPRRVTKRPDGRCGHRTQTKGEIAAVTKLALGMLSLSLACASATAQALELSLTPWGFLKGAAANNATASRKRVDGKPYTVLSWSPAVKAPSGKSYTINGYVNDKNYVERVETWVGDNIMGDMRIL